ncbi:MAG: Fe-S assembly protein [Arcobacter sp.]|nr:MAG: Fe-S assembly protein [Arcobacter sp.]
MKLINFKKDVLLIDKDTIEPITIIYNLKNELKNSLKIKVKENIKASIIEVYLDGNKDIEYDFKRELIVEKNAKLEYLKYQSTDEDSILNLDFSINLKENAIINMTNLELGLGISNNNFNTNLDNENSSLIIHGLVKLYNKSKSDSIFNTVHNAKNTSSDISYKHSLHDSSKALFEAKSIVNESANFSKVLQNTNTILLSDDAVIFARPHLEINIDELEASHGATTGSLDKEQLLYLQSRGIPKDEAYEMLLKAFENEVYDNIEDSKIKDFVENFDRSEYV